MFALVKWCVTAIILAATLSGAGGPRCAWLTGFVIEGGLCGGLAGLAVAFSRLESVVARRGWRLRWVTFVLREAAVGIGVGAVGALLLAVLVILAG